MHGGNFLLPFDIPVKGDKEKWPSIGDQPGKKSGKARKGAKGIK